MGNRLSSEGRRWTLAFAVMCIGLIGGAGSALAAPISYSEGPELSADPNAPSPLGSLDVGVNTVTGQVSCFFPNCFPSDSDAFAVTLPANLKITSITFNILAGELGNLLVTARDVDTYAPINFSEGFFFFGGLKTLFTGEAVGPGSLALVAGLGPLTPAPTSGSLGYVWSITVEESSQAQVPEPGTLALLGLAFAGLGRSRLRRQ